MNNTKKETKNSNRLKLASHPKQGLKALAYKIFFEIFYGKKKQFIYFFTILYIYHKNSIKTFIKLLTNTLNIPII